MISACIKDCLTYPESYETISTRIDSSRINVSKMEEIIELSKECAKLNDKINSLNFKYDLTKAEKEELKLNLKQKLNENISNLRSSVDNLYDKEINGWAVTHRFRCQNDYGAQMPPQEMVFFCDLNFERCQGWTAKQIESFFKIIECVDESETDNVFLNYLQDIRYIFNFL